MAHAAARGVLPHWRRGMAFPHARRAARAVTGSAVAAPVHGSTTAARAVAPLRQLHATRDPGAAAATQLFSTKYPVQRGGTVPVSAGHVTVSRASTSEARRRFHTTPLRPAASKARLCTDNMKYRLLNAVESCAIQDTAVYFRVRRKLYQRVYSMVMENKASEIKADNLYIFLYSHYYTLREMVHDSIGSRDAVQEVYDDEALKQAFRDMIADLPATATARDFDTRFMNVVRTQVPEGQEAEYVKLNKFIMGEAVSSKHGQVDVLQKSFIDGTKETDIFLAKKLAPDVHKFLPRHERLREWLVKYQFTHGWVTAGGIWVLGGAAPLFRFIFSGPPS